MTLCSLSIIIISVCFITQITSQQTEVTMRWNQFCDDSLVACTKNYTNVVHNKETTNDYYRCVFKVFCERWSEGYYNRQNILSEIQARKEYYDPESAEWWKNEARDNKISLRAMAISLFVILKVLHTIQY